MGKSVGDIDEAQLERKRRHDRIQARMRRGKTREQAERMEAQYQDPQAPVATWTRELGWVQPLDQSLNEMTRASTLGIKRGLKKPKAPLEYNGSPYTTLRGLKRLERWEREEREAWERHLPFAHRTPT